MRLGRRGQRIYCGPTTLVAAGVRGLFRLWRNAGRNVGEWQSPPQEFWLSCMPAVDPPHDAPLERRESIAEVKQLI